MPEAGADFEALYRSDADPFGVGSRWYERRKQAVLLASLCEERYDVAWDCAAGTGHLAAALAERCGSVVATDASPTAVELVADRTPDAPAVHATLNRLPRVPNPAARAELVVVAEVLYYLPEGARARLVDAVAGFAREVVLVHWAQHPHDGWLSGVAVHEEAGRRLAARGLTTAVEHVDRDFVLSSWLRS